MTAKAPVPLRPFRFTREQYYAMGRSGYFDNVRVELIHGEIVEMSPVNWPHHLAVKLVSVALTHAFANGHFVDVQQSFPVPGAGGNSAPQPDVAVIPGSPRDYTDHPTVAALIVEVSDTTLAYDMTTKAELYASASIAEYWVLDVTNRELHVYRDPQPLPNELNAFAYQSHRTLRESDSVSPVNAPQVTIPVRDLLP